MAGTEYLSTQENVSIKNQEEIVDNFVESTPYENMILAFELIMHALMTMPVMAYISFALSLVFMAMWLINPLSYISKEEPQIRKMVRKSNRTHKSST